LPRFTIAVWPQCGQITPFLAVEHGIRFLGGRDVERRIGCHARGSSSTSKAPPHLPQVCSQCLTLSVFTAITGLVMIGVRWPQPVT
jgi:hypothetical protein